MKTPQYVQQKKKRRSIKILYQEGWPLLPTHRTRCSQSPSSVNHDPVGISLEMHSRLQGFMRRLRNGQKRLSPHFIFHNFLKYHIPSHILSGNSRFWTANGGIMEGRHSNSLSWVSRHVLSLLTTSEWQYTILSRFFNFLKFESRNFQRIFLSNTKQNVYVFKIFWVQSRWVFLVSLFVAGFLSHRDPPPQKKKPGIYL